MRVRGYNGQADDDHVETSLYIAAPYDSIDADAGSPTWGGADYWPIASDSLKDGADVNQPKYVDENAYVSGGTLVASMTTAGIRLSAGLIEGNAGDIHLNLVGAFLTGNLVQVQTQNGNQWQLDHVVLAGRWPTDDLVQQMSQFPDVLHKERPLCMDADTYPLFRDLVCSYTDIYSGIGTPSVPCDALSFGIYLETSPAILGDVYTILPATPRCPDALDPKHDSCEGQHPTLPDAGTDAGADADDAGSVDDGGDAGPADGAADDATPSD